MRLTQIAVALASVALLAPAARAGDAPKGPWDGYGVGTTFTTKTTTKTSMQGAPEITTQARQTLVKVTDDAYVVKAENESAGTWTGQEITIPRKPTGGAEAPKPEDLGEDKVTVEGKEYSCKKQKTTVAGTTTIMWMNDTVGMLKSETTLPGGATTTMTVTALEKKVTAAGKDLTCRETTTVSKGSGADSTIVSLTSDAVPGGGMVRMEMKAQMGPITSTTLTELVSFEIK